MRILHTADWHLDLANLDYTVPAVEALIARARELKPDLIVHAGDIAVHRGSIHPHVSRQLRVLLTRLAQTAPLGMLLVEGNHDQVYTAGRDGAALGILAGEDSDQSADGLIRIVTTPQVVGYGDPARDLLEQTFVCVPSPNRYWLDAARANGAEEADVAGLLGTIVRGLIAEAGPGCIGVFHGSIAGGKAGDEFAMKAGMEAVLPASAWLGCDTVLCGHLHHAQTLGANRFLYPGSVAPLTWNDAALQPRAYLIETTASVIAIEAVWLPVVSQMLQANVEIVTGDATVPLHEQLLAAVRSTWTTRDIQSARLRLHLRAPGAVLDGMSVPAEEGLLIEYLGARDVTLVTERTDEGRVRFDMDASWGPLQAFERWLDLQGIKGHDERAALVALAEGVERQVEDAHLDARYEMRPISLAIKNWCQYADAEVEFDQLGKVVAVTGANYAGKSNLMRAILFALYKHQVSGNLLSDLIRKGEDRAVVSLQFESGGWRYMAQRELRRGSDGRKCAASFALLRLRPGDDEPDAWEPVNEGKANETQAAIERLVGPLDLFLATSFAGQNAVDGLLDLTPAEMKDLLLGVLQRDFAARSEILRAKMRLHEQQAATLRTKHGVYEAQGRAAGELADRLDGYSGLITEDEQALAAAEDPDAHLEAIAAARAEILRLEQAAGHRAEIAQRLTDTSGALSKAAAAVEAAQFAKSSADATEAEMAKLGVPDPSLPERLTAARNAYDAAIQNAAFDEAAARAESDAALRREVEARTVYGAAAEAHKAAGDAVDRAKRSADLLSRVPCEGALWGDAPGTDMGTCPLLRDAVNARDGLPELIAAADRCHGESEAACSVLGAARRETETLAAELTRVASEARTATSKARDAVQVLQAQADSDARLERKRAARNADLAANRERASGLAEALVRRDLLQQDVDRLTCDLAALTNGAGLTAAREALTAAERARQAAIATHDRLREQIDAHRREQASLQERLAAAQTAATEAGRLLSAVAVEENSHARAALVEEAMHRDGIPFLLLEQFAIPQLRGLVNRYLEQTDIRVAVETERELLGGEMRNAVELTFTDHRGQHPLSAASGFQRTAIGMALRNALADLHAAATGSKLWLTVQDEGLGTMDEAHLDGAKATIRTIAEHRGGHFIIASHVGGVADIADSVLAVHEVDGHSVVEVQP